MHLCGCIYVDVQFAPLTLNNFRIFPYVVCVCVCLYSTRNNHTFTASAHISVSINLMPMHNVTENKQSETWKNIVSKKRAKYKEITWDFAMKWKEIMN